MDVMTIPELRTTEDVWAVIIALVSQLGWKVGINCSENKLNGMFIGDSDFVRDMAS